jgi:hypothetical protein
MTADKGYMAKKAMLEVYPINFRRALTTESRDSQVEYFP